MLRTLRVAAIFVAAGLSIGAWTSRVQAQTTANVFPPEWVTRMNIPQMNAPPTIDGRIEPDEWRHSARLMGAADDPHVADFGGVDLAFHVAWDAEHLYLAGHAPLPDNKRLIRQRRERYTTEVIFDDAFEFGISLLGRNRAEGEVDSFFKFVLNELGAGEYLRIYPQIGQYLYNWRPHMAIANGVHEIDGRRVWQIEIAVPLDDLSMPREHRAGDPVRLLFNHSIKLPGVFGWNPIPTASGFLVDSQWPTGTLTADRPFIRIERLGGLHQDRVELTAVIVNPSDQPARVAAQVLVRNEGQPPRHEGDPLADRIVLDKRQVVEVPAGGEAAFVIDHALEGMQYSAGQEHEQRQHHGRRGYFQMTFTPEEGPEDETIYHFATVFKRQDGPNRFTQAVKAADDTAFPLSVRFNPVSSQLLMSADTLDAEKLGDRTADAMTYVVLRGDESVHRGRIDRFVHHKFEDVVAIPPLEPGSYRVVATLVDDRDAPLLIHEGVVIEKKDEAKQFAEWWDNDIGRTDRLLKPFEPIRVNQNGELTSVQITRRQYELNGLGLPEAIQSNGEAVLTGSVRIVAVIDGIEHEFRPSEAIRVVGHEAWEAQFVGRGGMEGLDVAVSGRVEQDGLTDLRLTFSPSGPAVMIEQLRIEWPLHDTLGNWIACIGVGGNYSARFIGKAPAGEGMVWNTLDHIGNVGSGMTLGNFYGNVWVGNEQRGLLWTADSDEGWVPRDDAPAHSLTRRGDTLVLTNHLISAPAAGAGPFVLDHTRTVQVQYMASPFRHLASGWRLTQGSSVTGFTEPPKFKFDWDTGEEYFSILSPPFTNRDRWPEYFAHTREVAQERSRGGLTNVRSRYRPYTTNQIALRGYQVKTRELHLYDYFGADWLTGGNETLNKTYTDYMMWLIDRHITEGGLAHIYYDIAMSMVGDARVAGLGYLLPDGRVQPTSMDAAVREWYKRTWALFQDHGLYPGGVSGHATNAIILKTLPFTDAVLDSEFSMVDPISAFPSDRMIAMSVPHTFGTMIDHLGIMNPHWAAMHDANIGGGAPFGDDGGSLFWTIPFRSFGISRDDVTFVLYWRNSHIVRDQPDGLMVSMWKRPGAAIIALLNHGGDDTAKPSPLPVRLSLDLEALGVPAGLEADRMRIGELVVNDNRVSNRWHGRAYEWFEALPVLRESNEHQWRKRSDIQPRIDAASGIIDGFEVDYRDVRYVLLTWDHTAPDARVLALFPDDATRLAALHWGLFAHSTRPLSEGELQRVIALDHEAVTIHAWHRGDGVLLRLHNPTDQPLTVTASLNLEQLGLDIRQLWAQFLLPFDIASQVLIDQRFDGWEGHWAIPLDAGQVRTVSLIRN